MKSAQIAATLIAAALALAACATPAAPPTPEADAANGASLASPYAPMAMFAPFAGKTFRGEWTADNGETLVDIATWELILNGRALQSTHRLQGKDYGGRTIFFFDEGAKNYVFHYFTTAGFHTTGVSQFVDGGLVSEETVEGASNVASVRSKATFGPDAIEIDVVYVGKDGTETPGGRRVYKEIADPGRLFADTK
ncbi:MAG: hypothetical protein A3E78_14080 [Alphaproteobacteria bacterium RIFCSPHIGHO2_12_FULL_63_12]|nr:MAG: hypothetical protein A3E78_14080 [Alphaproteobacteria bacterium RIFCSPHIGHO2_12_FULL_63_12]